MSSKACLAGDLEKKKLNQFTKYEELKAVCWGIDLPSMSSQTILKNVFIPYQLHVPLN